jgi:UDP-glucose 4-epimerase
MRETVLVTGALGFLGRAICRYFGEEGWRVVGVDLLPGPDDLPAGLAAYHAMALPSPAFETIVAEYQPHVCVHGAGCASVGMSMDDPAADYRGNTALVFEVLDAIRRNAADCRFLLLSSAAVYGDPASLPVTEAHPVRPLSPYGYHKRQAELLCEEFTAIYGVPSAATRIFSAYGVGLRRQVVWDICERVLKTGKLKLHGTGTESRDFIHAIDIARGLHCLATKAPCAGEIYNLATGCELTIAELAARLLGALDCAVLPEFDGAATPGNPRNWRADISRIAALGFQPAISLEQGLGEVADWCRGELTKSGALAP